jgi:hypothetical protein
VTPAEAISNALERMPEIISLFEAYEEAIEPDQMKAVIVTIVALKEGLQALAVQGDYLGAAYRLKLAREEVDQARLLLASYAPYGKSLALCHLERRQKVTKLFKQVEWTARRIVASTGQPKREGDVQL